MQLSKPLAYLDSLITEMRKLPAETGWVEFKENLNNPEDIGEYLSALSNAAALENKPEAYLIWGIQDTTHEPVGTTFNPWTLKKSNEDLQNWLARLLSPRLHFQFHEVLYDGKRLVVLEIPRPHDRPVQFQGVEFIRVGSCRQKLKDHPQLERDLWRAFDTTFFEEAIAQRHVPDADVLSLLDYPTYFDLLQQPQPSDQKRTLDALAAEGLIVRDSAGQWDITHLGAVLLARNLEAFKSLARKVVRVVVYEGRGRLKTLRELPIRKGYAVGFKDLIVQINALLPRSELIEHGGIRREVPAYPEAAVRELIPNALIHQDFSVTGAGPLIEIFSDRIEITNPGEALVKPERFLDSPPRSRNETLASFMRRFGICEERGSGVDKVVEAVEQSLLPAPLFEIPPGFTRVVLFAHRPLGAMTAVDRSRACYLHACLRYVQRAAMTNASLRTRFAISEQNKAMVSRIIARAVKDGLIKPEDPEQGRKHARYIPFWA